MSQQQQTVDLQIVGGGLAGLIAANLAVDAGLSVRLIEPQTSFGGRATSADHHGYTLNQGPHALYLQGELRATLQTLGIKPTGASPEIKGATGSIGSNVGLLPGGPISLLRSSLLPARGKLQLAKLMASLARIDTDRLASTTVAQWLDDTTDVPELQTLLTGLINLSTYTFAPETLSAGAALAQLQMALDDGVHYIDGGWVTIVDDLAERLQTHQAVATGRFEQVTAKVSALTTERGIHTCQCDGTNYPATAVLLAAGSPTVADRLLGTGSTLADEAGPPVQAAVLDLGLRSNPSTQIHLGLDSGLYLSTHSAADRVTPAGQTLVSVARYLRHPAADIGSDDASGNGTGHEAELSPDETRALLLAHARAAGIPAEDIVMDRYLHRLTVAHGMPLAARGGRTGRPAVAVSGRPGVFVAGDWVGPDGLLADASAASATEAVRQAVESRTGQAPVDSPEQSPILVRPSLSP